MNASSTTGLCPLCDGPAEAAIIGGARKHYRCATCVEFVLSLEAEEPLRQLSRTSLRQLSRQAAEASSRGERLVLRTPSEAEQAAQRPSPLVMLDFEPHTGS